MESAGLSELRELAAKHQVPLMELGKTEGNRFVIGELMDLPLDEIAEAWRGTLGKAMG